MERQLVGRLMITAALVGCPAMASAQASKAVPATAGDWVAIKNPEELKAFFSDKTFKGVGWTAYYLADGTGFLVVDGGKPSPRTWQVKGDQVCVSGDLSGVTSCRSIQRNRKDRNEITMMNPISKEMYTVRVEEGISALETRQTR
jgi:hypothetical protein